ncbi:MAG: hypothetical protein SGPRY_010013, partial [Prymnesium sp.]
RPSFLEGLREGGEEGISAALKRRREGDRDLEPEERSDNEEERPQIVEAAEAMTAAQRRCEEAAARRVGRQGGSLRFKDSTAERFKECAAVRVQEVEAAASNAALEHDEGATAASGHHVFSNTSDMKKVGKKRTSAPGASAKAVKNSKLLSFAVEEDG